MGDYFLHQNAIVESEKIGKGTRVWAFAHILPGALIGEDCNICDHTFIENDVVLGNRVTIKSGVQLWDGLTLEDDVFVGPNATFTNDPYPRSKQYPETFSKTLVRKGASIGANATILPGLTIGQSAMIGAGAVVMKDVPPYAIVVGNPARIVGYCETTKSRSAKSKPVTSDKTALSQPAINAKGVKLYEMPVVVDLRGSLTFGEYDKQLPFAPVRYFLIHDVPSREIRGEHAHYQCQQFLICIKGSCSVVVDDGENRDEILLDRPSLGLFIPAMIWATEYKYSPDAVLLVLASEIYKAEDYIRDYDLFLKEIQAK